MAQSQPQPQAKWKLSPAQFISNLRTRKMPRSVLNMIAGPFVTERREHTHRHRDPSRTCARHTRKPTATTTHDTRCATDRSTATVDSAESDRPAITQEQVRVAADAMRSTSDSIRKRVRKIKSRSNNKSSGNNNNSNGNSNTTANMKTHTHIPTPPDDTIEVVSMSPIGLL